MNYLSVCSGIEAASCAWHPLGWSPVAFAEVDAFPSAVLAHHYPNVPNRGDMTKFQEWPNADVDVLVGGTPCQSFSVAGLRAGLDDPRGNLALTYLAVVNRYRPRWVVWENVPGVLSSDSHDAPDPSPPTDDVDEGTERVVEDEYDADEIHAFACFLAGLSELGYGFAYRVLDAQYFGLAQRRARVFVVGCLGDWRRAAAVLFERESLSGHPAPRREAGQVAPTVPSRRAAGGGLGADFDCDGGLVTNERTNERTDLPPVALCLNAGAMGRIDAESETLIPIGGSFDVSGTLQNSGRAAGSATQQDAEAGLLVPFTLAIRGRGDSHDLEYRQDGIANAILTPNGGRAGIGVGAIAFLAKDHGADAGEIAPTLRAGGFPGSHANGGVMPAVAFDARRSDVLQYGEKTGPLDTDGHSIAVAFRSDAGRSGEAKTPSPDAEGRVRLRDAGFNVYEEVAPTLDASAPHGVGTGLQIRRLTPRECERLQGFPDDYTLIPYRGKFAADGPRYKALGNSMAVPVMAWIGRRVQMVERLSESR